MKTNYSNNDNKSPLKRGKLSDVVKPRRSLYKRMSTADKIVTITEMRLDLVQILAEIGIILQNTHTISKLLIARGWVKTKKIEKGT